MDIVTSDGTTLLGADDKAGVAEIMTAVDLFMRNPELDTATIKIGFTPDEEIGNGTKYFDVKKFGADFAYTLDGGPLGEIENETFNAFQAVIKIEGVGVHPGYAKDKLVNAIRVFADIVTRLPKDMAPETTEERQGYIHPYDFQGQAEAVTIKFLLRDFDMEGIEQEKKILTGIVEEVRALYPKAKIDLEFKEQYLNMRYHLEKDRAGARVRRGGDPPDRHRTALHVDPRRDRRSEAHVRGASHAESLRRRRGVSQQDRVGAGSGDGESRGDDRGPGVRVER